VKVFHIQRITHTIFGPNHLFGNLTLGTMPIATTVITEAFVGATVVIALVFMSAKCWRAALLQCIVSLPLPPSFDIDLAPLSLW
jgi:hypothetical protein